MTAAVRMPGLAKRAFDDGRDFDEASGAFVPRIPLGVFDIVTDEKTSQRWFWFKCPGKCGSIAPIALRPVVDPGMLARPGFQSWDFDGNLDAPTLSPSVNHVDCWHGWLRGGVWSLA